MGVSPSPAVVVALLTVAAILSGCMGGDPVGPPTNGTNGTGGGDATYSVRFTNAPPTTETGALASFTWRVSGPQGDVNQSEVRWDTASHAEVLPDQVASAYVHFVEGFGGPWDVDQDINRMIVAPEPGTWYVRAWARVDGTIVATSEHTWTVTASNATQ